MCGSGSRVLKPTPDCLDGFLRRGRETMDQNQSFEAFLAAVARGDEEAVARLCHDFGPVVIRAVARRFEHSYLQTVFDPSGILHRVVRQLRLDLAAGKCNPHTPAELSGLLRN